MKYWVLLLTACGQDLMVVKINQSEALTADQKALCPRLPEFATAGRVKARLEVELDDAARTKLPPCEMTVGVVNDELNVKGDCAGIPRGGFPLFRMVWYTTSPTPAVAKDVILAEAQGRARDGWDEQRTTPLHIDPVMEPALKPKTRAGATESSVTKDKFNCDRTGTNVCDSSMAAPPSTGADQDTCSNLQELCADTLFASSVDKCN